MGDLAEKLSILEKKLLDGTLRIDINVEDLIKQVANYMEKVQDNLSKDENSMLAKVLVVLASTLRKGN